MIHYRCLRHYYYYYSGPRFLTVIIKGMRGSQTVRF